MASEANLLAYNTSFTKLFFKNSNTFKISMSSAGFLSTFNFIKTLGMTPNKAKMPSWIGFSI